MRLVQKYPRKMSLVKRQVLQVLSRFLSLTSPTQPPQKPQRSTFSHSQPSQTHHLLCPVLRYHLYTSPHVLSLQSSFSLARLYRLSSLEKHLCSSFCIYWTTNIPNILIMKTGLLLTGLAALVSAQENVTGTAFPLPPSLSLYPLFLTYPLPIEHASILTPPHPHSNNTNPTFVNTSSNHPYPNYSDYSLYDYYFLCRKYCWMSYYHHC